MVVFVELKMVSSLFVVIICVGVRFMKNSVGRVMVFLFFVIVFIKLVRKVSGRL